MNSDNDILKSHPVLARTISDYSPAFRSSLAESYCHIIARSGIVELSPRESEAYTNVVGKYGFTVADVIVLRFAVDRANAMFYPINA